MCLKLVFCMMCVYLLSAIGDVYMSLKGFLDIGWTDHEPTDPSSSKGKVTYINNITLMWTYHPCTLINSCFASILT